ncbi:tRNA (adenosine(37)-N6)-dimethylallyltransferase MiaA [Ketogulonicigenium vulgare]|uniref:tRNA (adenosine(37)-N6)-dimethylallyltransferase MiaA n=1 Tax=Ketogulonicigenium vulgare TaxID=92945 RepID=UPI0023582A41|nr:tRNA (adenosine(37)-N6)-dimethylallyltransferase MiaA [Ketogulonicigenium vulgare]
MAEHVIKGSDGRAFALDAIAPDRPVLIAGPTASGKSALALQIAEHAGGVIINADALQVFGGWRILTARPDDADLARAPHRLYGHVPFDGVYSVGHWLRDIAPLLGGARPIIVGGTGLYFHALTQGLADIPATPPAVRGAADEMDLPDLVAGLDSASAGGIDLNNRARVQRAWEVLQATGEGIAAWQSRTPAPLLPLDAVYPIAMMPDVDWLNARIAQRFDLMIAGGALEEARAMLPHWDPAHLSSKAIGAPELIAHLQGAMPLDEARDAAVIATRQYAKRQRTWFRARMKAWQHLHLGRGA